MEKFFQSRMSFCSVLLFFLLLFPGVSRAVTDADRKEQMIVQKCLPFLKQITREKRIISDVLTRNTFPLGPNQIKSDEEDWQKIGISDFKQTILFSQSSDVIRQYEPSLPLMVKCFVLDRQGDVVGAVPESKTFAHGQMDKFLKCFNQGRGQVYVNPPGLDVSTSIYSVQVSVPIFDGGKTIGVLVATISLE